MAGGAGVEANRVVLSGHGSWSPSDGYTTVPEGTTFHTYAPLGETIYDGLGNAIETNTLAQYEGSYSLTTYGPGSQVPNLTLHSPEGLVILGNPVTVEANTLLGNLLLPNMGDVHWAACLIIRC
jgi:hypothetical protein